MIRLLATAALRYFADHRLQLVMSVAGVAIGVAMVAGVDLATTSASRAFQLSTQTVSGSATLQLSGPAGTIDEKAYVALRTHLGVQDSSPVVEGYVRTDAGTFRLLGIDVFGRDAPGRALAGFPSPGELLLRPDRIVISGDAAARLRTNLGDSVRVSFAGRSNTLAVIGVVSPLESSGRQGWVDLMVTDISTAQRVLDSAGRLTRIDLFSEETEALGVAQRMGEAVVATRPAARTAALSQMTQAFETNLQALSYLALVVGMFLIFNIMSFSVVQRRPVYSRLRAAGVPARLITRSVVAEALVLGVVGSLIGVAAGAWLGQVLVGLVTRAINDLYFVVNVREAALTAPELLKAGALGVGASLLAAWIPARRAARVSAAVAMRRSEEEEAFARQAPQGALIGLGLGTVGLVVILQSGGIAGAYAGLFLIIAAFALSGPFVILLTVRALSRLRWSLSGRMALRSIDSQLSRTAVAIVALSISVAAAVGVGVMVGSFRSTVVEWLGTTLQADIYVSAPGGGARLGGGLLTEEAVRVMRASPGVEATFGVRRVEITTSIGPATAVIVEHGARTRGAYRFLRSAAADPWSALQNGSVFVSEPFAFRHGVAPGDTLEVPTEQGVRRVPIAAEYVDFGSDVGVMLIDRAVYTAWFGDPGYGGLALYLQPESDVTAVAAEVSRATAGFQTLVVQSNASLRSASLEVFDRTFAITGVLQILALVVAVIGVISALSAIQLERSWEFAVQRAIGMRRGTLARLILLQSAIMGFLAGMLALPLGLALAAGLVFVINRRSFGWSLDFSIAPEILLQAVFVSVASAVVAALIPAWSTGARSLASRLRSAIG
ncbi:MAG: putative ABC transport system permease protein [Rhodothermales bacterium]